ncbi:DOPA 4,5-dioxygenase family protein [Pseudomonas sp. Marseille-QA0892]
MAEAYVDPTAPTYHAHIYFDDTSVEQARLLCEGVSARFAVQVGRMHHKPVGPHPDWSCQLTFAAHDFGQVVPWLALNRSGLVIFIHPNTGDDLMDHRDRALWMGAVRPLDLSIFAAEPAD